MAASSTRATARTCRCTASRTTPASSTSCTTSSPDKGTYSGPVDTSTGPARFRDFTMMELKDALSQALTRNAEDYVLAVIVGNVELPAGLIDPHVGQLRIEDFSPVELAEALAER